MNKLNNQLNEQMNEKLNSLNPIDTFSDVRTVTIDGAPWFVALDICRALGISNSRMALSRLDDDEKDVALTDTPGGMQRMGVVNEYGLYNLILGSRKPEPMAFKRWLTHSVLPAIRREGGYSTSSPEELLVQAKMLLEQSTADTHQ